MPEWVPAPGMSSKNSKARLKAKEDRRNSYPLCLVCEYDHEYEVNSFSIYVQSVQCVSSSRTFFGTGST